VCLQEDLQARNRAYGFDLGEAAAFPKLVLYSRDR
jgi:hypothetical protein